MAAAAVTGAACVGFAKGFEFVQNHRLDFSNIGKICWLLTPLVFLLAVELVRRFGPYAAGTGIPQAIYVAARIEGSNEDQLRPLFSTRTLVVKVVALLLGVWVGASTGREGPTVHVAVCVFMLCLVFFRRWARIPFNLRSAAIASGAAGLAAAFNTPLAGVTFAIEELTDTYFSTIKDFVLMAIIVAAIAAQSLTGEYSYFGKLTDSPRIPFAIVLLIGLVAGGGGILFSLALLRGSQILPRFLRLPGARYAIPVAMAAGLLAITAVNGIEVLGPGNRTAQALLQGQFGSWTITFPLAKAAATLFTYWSGIAGGIFAPCLSMGAALGASIGHWAHVATATCALIGMAAFLCGAIQAPMTAFVIIFEMTGHHEMLLPVMLASLLTFMLARLFQVPPLYKALADQYQALAGPVHSH